MSYKSPKPVDAKLYERVKKQVYIKYPKHSAYRSGHLVKKYKEEFKKKYPNKEPYTGKKPKKVEGGLSRWFEEDWKSDTGKYKYTSKSSVYRPTKRVSKKTPLTFNELTKSEIKKAKRTKSEKGRIKRFRK
jgi:hypothetical protein